MVFKKKNLILTIFVGLLTVVLYFMFLRSEIYDSVRIWAEQNRGYYYFYLLIFKIISILWPPMAGGIITLASIPVIGWIPSYLIDLTGSILGGSISFYLGKKYGIKILSFLFDKEIIKKIKKIKVKKEREMEAVFMYRIFFGSTIIEAIYYGAGLLKINYTNFLFGAIFSHILVGVPAFFFADNILGGKNLIITFGSLLVGIPFFLKFKGRHFE